MGVHFALYICFTIPAIFLIIAGIKNIYLQLTAVGLVAHIIISTIINLGMVTGILPTVGIPLPFITYGITNLWISFASLGWFNNLSRKKNF